jgi:hypothetical protein
VDDQAVFAVSRHEADQHVRAVIPVRMGIAAASWPGRSSRRSSDWSSADCSLPAAEGDKLFPSGLVGAQCLDPGGGQIPAQDRLRAGPAEGHGQFPDAVVADDEVVLVLPAAVTQADLSPRQVVAELDREILRSLTQWRLK